MSNPFIPPWERYTTEDDKEWAAFRYYCHMAKPRKIFGVVGYSHNWLVKVSVTNEWVERAKAWDKHIEAIFIAEREALARQEAKEITAEHMSLLHSARQLAQRELDKYLAQATDEDNPLVTSLKPGDLVKLMETVIKFDRLIRDQSTENVQSTADLSSLTLEELREYRRIRAKVEAPKDAHTSDRSGEKHGVGDLH